ncbi:MAG: 2Fe-2S iron-sulfur cluster-binding protein [Methanomicrobiales archaeon]|nr:2Fe-2S iron-sulfur cluster-binding protein [Methanomicrobiales archaeon]
MRDPDRCEHCEICETLVPCARAESRRVEDCTGCGACAAACPEEAIRMEMTEQRGTAPLTVNGEPVEVPVGVTVQQALESLGHTFGRFPGDGDHFAPCGTGGCFACAVVIGGVLQRSCVTPVREGMEIRTEIPQGTVPLRAVTGWTGHGVGGVGTPWQLQGSRPLIEAAVFACGCNLRCPQCQNWTVTYRGNERPETPREAAVRMTMERRRLGVSRMAISGGECTLNRPWLTRYLQELVQLNPDPAARLHVDTNATILTPDYVDDLVAAGMTDIGPDLKGYRPETFMAITGVADPDLAARYLRTSWEAVRYLADRYSGQIFLGVGIPYHPLLISREEIALAGDALCRIDPAIQVTVLDYRPAFRRRDLPRPGVQEMEEIRRLLTGTGLRTVICQTAHGPVGP